MANPNPAVIRTHFQVDPALREWVTQNTEPGGVLGGDSHAVERALHLLQQEHTALRERCRAAGLRFTRDVLARAYAAELEATKPSPGGRPSKSRKDEEGRGRIYATVAVDLLAWARDTLVDAGPFEGMSQVVEVGLRRVRAMEERRAGVDVEDLWRALRR